MTRIQNTALPAHNAVGGGGGGGDDDDLIGKSEVNGIQTVWIL